MIDLFENVSLCIIQKMCMKAIWGGPLSLKHVQEMCIKAVEKNTRWLQYVSDHFKL